jgi:hypothetical protein
VDRVWFCTHDCMNDGWGFGSLDNVFGYLTERCACAADGAAAGEPCTRPRDCAPHCCCPDKNRIAVRMCIQGRCVDRERACSEVGSCW